MNGLGYRAVKSGLCTQVAVRGHVLVLEGFVHFPAKKGGSGLADHGVLVGSGTGDSQSPLGNQASGRRVS